MSEKGRKREKEDTAMNDVEIVFEEFETSDHAGGYSSKDILWNACGLELIERAGIHVLHAVVDTRLDEKGTVKFDDFRCDCAMEDVEFHDDSI